MAKKITTRISTQKVIEAAHAAGAVLKKNFGKKLDVRKKFQAGLVTNVDLAAEAAAMRILKKARPDFVMLTEESNPNAGESQGRWVIDPLDGTTNFVHGFPMFCVSLAAEWEGEVVCGVIYHPILNDTYVAVKGKGAFLNKKRLRVSKTNQLEDSLLTTGFSDVKDASLQSEVRVFGDLSRTARAIRRPGSAALDLAYVARGVFDAFWERRLSPWDIAAGALLVEEAGGKVTDFAGNRYQLKKPEILASTPAIHSGILASLKNYEQRI